MFRKMIFFIAENQRLSYIFYAHYEKLKDECLKKLALELIADRIV